MKRSWYKQEVWVLPNGELHLFRYDRAVPIRVLKAFWHGMKTAGAEHLGYL